MRVVICGPGRIGCGYLAPTFARSGWEVVLACRTPEVAETIARLGRARVKLSAGERRGSVPGEQGMACFEVDGLKAVCVEEDAFVDAVARADLVCCAVGVGNVSSLASPLARALAARRSPIDVWVVENADLAAGLEAAVRARAAEAGLRLPLAGFAGAVATCVVAHGAWEPGQLELPTFVGDRFRRLLVDGRRVRTGVPAIEGVSATSCYRPRLREKLFGFNAGHAVCAYLGWLRGHTTVAEAIHDPFLRPIVSGCMLESRRALLGAHPELGSDLHGPVAEALARFGDFGLADRVERVARQPLRKLSPGDRLLGPVELMRAQKGEVPSYFALALAGALLYRGAGDAQAAELKALLARHGVSAVLERVCGLGAGDPFGAAVAERYHGFIFTPEGVIFPGVHLAGAGVTW